MILFWKVIQNFSKTSPKVQFLYQKFKSSNLEKCNSITLKKLNLIAKILNNNET